MSSLWVVMIPLGLLTFGMRLSFVLLLERWQPPEVVTRALRFVPVAVLTAIFIPEIMLQDGSLTILPLNPRLFAGLAAILVAWKTKSALWTIAAGMAVFWLVAWLIK
ncbi:MAG: AzlD domain-containing protein [Pelolinea sp.]|nr:AzlD domain-containing protein [Pelolinea sp.]